MAVGQKLSLRCFLEGIEVPIIAASLTINLDAPAQCQVQLPATDAILKLKPRTLVHIFYYDYWGGPGDTLGNTLPSEDQAATNTEVHRQEEFDTSFRMEHNTEELTDGLDFERIGFGSDRMGLQPMPDFESAEGATAERSGDRPVAHGQVPQAAGPMRGGAADGETEGVAIEGDNSRWKLYFCGEVTAIQFVKSVMKRSVVLNCMDNSLYWDTCYQYKMNTAGLTGDGQAAFVGAGTTLRDTFFQDDTSTIVQIARSTPVSQPDLTGLLAGVVALLERVGGVYRRGSQNFSGVNDFFTIAELRLKLVYQITAASEDFSSQHVFSRRAFAYWGRRQAGRLGKIASFREIVNLMNKFIFHNVVPNPIARYEPPLTEEDVRVRSGTIQLAETDRGREAVEELDYVIGLGNSLIYTGGIGAHLDSTGMRGVDNYIRSVGSFHSRIQSLATRFRRLGAGHTASAVSLAAQYSGSANGAVQSLGTFGLEGESRIANTSDQRLTFAVDQLETARARFTGEQRNFRRSTTVTRHLGNRLNSQIVRPDIYFVAPPRCNVLFPELYSQVQYQRAFMKEVTRMRLTVTDEIFGDDELLNNCYYAPDVAVLGARRRSQLGRRSRRTGSGDPDEYRTLDHAAYSRRLMDHELYTGVIPMFERMNEVNIYGNRTDSVVHRGARISYVDRAVNHQFFKHRFSPRAMSVQGKFNPSAVCGFPALVLDRHMNADTTRLVTSGYFSEDFFSQLWSAGRDDTENLAAEQEGNTVFSSQGTALREAWDTLKRVTPTQYLGLVASMTHSVSQDAGSTSYSIQSARTHNENEELLGANNVRVAVRAAGDSPTRRTVVAALSEPEAGMVGPFHGVITEVEPVEMEGEYLLFGTFSANRPRRQQSRVTVNQARTAREHGPEATVLVGNPTLEVTFRPYRVTERIDRWVGADVDIPLEDFIRPPWMSDIWRNDRIGSVYHQLFGTGAITDPMVVASASGSTPDAAVTDSQAQLDDNARARRDGVAGGELRPNPYDTGTDLHENPFEPDRELAENPFDTGTELRENPFAQDSNVDSLNSNGGPSMGSTVQSALTDITVERATQLLTRIYSSIKHEGLDAHEFIRAYNWRPVATLEEMLGSFDLEINNRGQVEQGTEGFHSRAFGHGEMGRDLRNIIDPDDTEVRSLLNIRMEGDDRDNDLRRLDKRAEKAEVVMRYVQELWDSRGLLG